jgi:hypothetical protein
VADSAQNKFERLMRVWISMLAAEGCRHPTMACATSEAPPPVIARELLTGASVVQSDFVNRRRNLRRR